MTRVRDTYCSYCGTAYPPPLAYPRTCPSCKTQVWANPIPVAVVLVPVVAAGRTGLLVVRRAIEPQIGKLALVGGFVEEQESWQVAGARELREEVSVEVDAQKITPFWFTSTEPRPSRVLLFGVAAALSALPPFEPNHEAIERGVVFGPVGLDDVFAFPLHVAAATRWFAAESITGSHAFMRL